MAVLQVAGIKPKMLPKTEFKNKDGEGHVYYPFKMTAKTVYDQWPESMRYRIWVSGWLLQNNLVLQIVNIIVCQFR